MTPAKPRAASPPQSPGSRSGRIVAIGASAGGLEAINTFFDNLPETKDKLCFVVVQHLSPDHKSLMPELLARHTSLRIRTVEDSMAAEAGTIYLISPDRNIRIENGAFVTEARSDPGQINFPINMFFKSLAEAEGEHAIGVVLSGSGSDGTLGIEAIKAHGGTVIVQDEASAAFDSMPRNAIATGLVDIVLPPEEIPTWLIGLVRRPHTARAAIDPSDVRDEELIDAILKLVNRKINIDFTDYKKNTILRRIERRMATREVDSLRDYLVHLTEHEGEAEILAREFLIGVTGFFRDSKPFAYLARSIVPKLFAQKANKGEIRVWCVGCSTGEEAYSLAILFREYLDAHPGGTQVKIFATDIDPRSIERASRGVYAASVCDGLSRERLERFFEPVDDGYQIRKEIRDSIVFARHDVIKDPPFNSIDLVTCRNLLIYLDAGLQRRILSFFSFALDHSGYLFLGSSETAGAEGSHYRALHRTHKIYQRKEGLKPPEIASLYPMSVPPKPEARESEEPAPGTVVADSYRILNNFKDALLEDTIAPSVIVNERNEVVHVAGKIHEFLRLPRKQLNLNVLKMVPESLYIPLNTLLARARKEKAKVRYGAVRVDLDGKRHYVELVARLFTEPASRGRYAIVSFVTLQPGHPDDPSGDFDYDAARDQRVKQLEQEVQETKHHLQATVEELETSNEELQATNEELIASNEELQSTNEELQSVNEELYSVNNEFQSKIAEMTHLTEDVDNLLQSTEIGTIFLDEQLRIRKFTAAATSQIKITESDLGRSVEDFSSRLLDGDLVADTKGVLESRQAIEREVRNRDGSSYLMRVLPYRNADEEARGAVLTFVNIDPLKSTEEALLRQTEQLRRTNRELEQFAYVATHDLRSPAVNLRGLVDLFQRQGLVSPENREIVEKIDACVDRLQAHLRDLIEVATGRGAPTERALQLELAPVLADVESDLAEAVRNAKATVRSDFTAAPEVWSAPAELRSILQNLLTNALKFRAADRRPEIEIRSAPMDGFVCLSVSDNGCGIDPAQRDKVFGLFQRLNGDVEGRGVGLFITRSQIEAQGGRIEFDSTPGQGTTFRVYFADRGERTG